MPDDMPRTPHAGRVAGETQPPFVDGSTAAAERAVERPDPAEAFEEERRRMMRTYWRFGAMIATSTAVMFVLMYLNTYAWDHVEWSETRFYMAIVMGAAMAVIMLSFMFAMYENRTVNIAILVGAVAIFAGSLWLVRSQTTVQDESYMRAMIPHHSIAILTSERSELTDLRVLELANEIILAQRREIDEMQWLIDDIAENGEVTTQAELEARPVPDFTATNGRDELTDASSDGSRGARSSP
jgi:uncharacterized protein (DUF305 family)